MPLRRQSESLLALLPSGILYNVNPPFSNRAELLNKAVKSGLYDASRDANINKVKAIQSLRTYGLLNTFVFLGGFDPVHIARSEPVVAGLALALINTAILRDTIFGNIIREHEEKPKIPLRDVYGAYSHSAFVGLAPDRHLGAIATVATSKFVKARN